MSLCMISWIIGYVVGSLVWGYVDALELRSQDYDLMNVPSGDIGEFVFPKRILGIHNILFFPSLIPIGICWVVNQLF